jgi:hypothetical protein
MRFRADGTTECRVFLRFAVFICSALFLTTLQQCTAAATARAMAGVNSRSTTAAIVRL